MAKHKNLSFSYRLLAGVAISCLMTSVHAHAETASTDAAADSDSGTIVVYAPIRDAQAAALQEERLASNMVDIIASDTVGRFPDQNTAAALARLPAVAVQRDQGQERYIQVRGAPNRWTSVSFDGVPVIGVDEGGTSRAFRFDAVPAVMMHSIAVNKSLTPDLPAEAVVAQIDLRTFSPFDAKGLSVQADLGYGVMELGKHDQRQGSARVSWSNDSFGFVLGASHYRRNQTTDNHEFSYDSTEDRDLTSFDARSYRLIRENNGITAGLEWRPAEGQRLFAKFLYSEFNDDEERNQYTFLVEDALSKTKTSNGYDLVGVPVRSSAEYGKYRNRNYIGTIGGDLEQDRTKATFRFNYTRTENTTDLPIIMQMQTSPTLFPSMSLDLSNPNLPVATLYSTISDGAGGYTRGAATPTLNQSAFNYYMALPIVSETTSDSYTTKADITRETGFGSIKAGFQYDDRQIDGNTMSTSNYVYLSAYGMPLNAGDYVTNEAWKTGFPLGFTANYLDNKGMYRDYQATLAKLTEAGLFDPDSIIDPATIYNINEKILAGYAMAKFEFTGGQIVAGVRVEQYSRTSDGFMVAGGVVTPLSVDYKKTDIFPSINARFDLNRDIVARASFQRGIARPSFGAIRPGASINDTTTPPTITGGNPYLKPEYTWGADAALEYYIPGDGVLSISGFSRWVDDVLYDSYTTANTDIYNSNGIDRSGYRFESTLNGGKGKLYGIELSYMQQWSFLPGALSGLGFQGNVALLDGSFAMPGRKNAPFPGTSKKIVNASIFYEKYGVSARVSYQWRDDWADTLGGLGLGSGGDEYRKAYGNLDVSLRYALTRNFTLYADLNNLTDEKYIAYQGDENHPTEVEQIGRRYMFGVRVNF